MNVGFLETLKRINGDSDNTFIISLATSYGTDIDKAALHKFLTTNSYYKAPTDGMEHFVNDFGSDVNANYIHSGCNTNIENELGYFIVNNPELGKECIFLYKKFQDAIVIHPFEILDGSWKLITPTKVSFKSDRLSIDVLENFTTTPDGHGRDHGFTLENAQALKDYAIQNLVMFCFISNQCYAFRDKS